VGSVSLAKGGTSRGRPSPRLHGVPTGSGRVSPRSFQTAPVITQGKKHMINNFINVNISNIFQREIWPVRLCWSPYKMQVCV
jgi:hypothetical protein